METSVIDHYIFTGLVVYIAACCTAGVIYNHYSNRETCQKQRETCQDAKTRNLEISPV